MPCYCKRSWRMILHWISSSTFQITCAIYIYMYRSIFYIYFQCYFSISRLLLMYFYLYPVTCTCICKHESLEHFIIYAYLKTLITTNNQGTMHFWIFFVICNALFMHLSKCIFAWPSLIKIYNNHSKLMFWIINYCIYWGKCYPYWNSLRVVDFRQNINAWIASCFHQL